MWEQEWECYLGIGKVIWKLKEQFGSQKRHLVARRVIYEPKDPTFLSEYDPLRATEFTCLEPSGPQKSSSGGYSTYPN